MSFVQIKGFRLYYEVHGPEPGRAPAIVFAHGAGGNHLSWWQQVPHFMDRYTCVTFDHRGFGQSADAADGPSGAAFVDDLRALLDHLGLRRTALVAQSMGGWTCLGFTLRHPERVSRLVMCDTHGGLASEEIAEVWSLGRLPLADLPLGTHPAAGARMRREQPALHFLYTQIAALNPLTLGEIGETIRAAGAPPLTAAATIRVPVLFVIGEEDIVIPPRVLELAAAAFPHGRIEYVPAAGHSGYFERPAAFNALVDRFLAAP